MKINSLVIVNLASPQQRFVGRLLGIATPGITVRGLDMVAFEDWMNHVEGGEETGVHVTTTFFPLHRVEKVILDERAGAIPSLADTFLSRVGSPIERHLEES